MPMKRKRLCKSKKKAVSEKQGLGTKVVGSPKGNHILDNVKCYECGKCGHYKKQCPEKGRSSPVQGCEEGNHILDNVKCYECGKCGHYKKQCPEKGRSSPVQGCEEGNRILHNKKCYKCGKCGHYVKQCPENRISSPVQGCEVLTTATTTNLEGGNMPEDVLPVASPVTQGKHNLDNLKCFECGMFGHFRNQCRNNDLCSPMQAYAVLPTVATTWLEGGNTTQFGAPATLPALPTPLSNHNRDSVKCFECGKRGHYRDQCDSVKCFECGKRGHYRDQCDSVKRFQCGKRGHYQDQCDKKCFECGESGHYQNRCPKRKRSSPPQAYEALLTATTTNSEGGNMLKHGALATSPTLPTTLENHNLDHSMCYECGKDEHFQNQCPDSKVSAPTQADAVLPIAATTDLEANKRRIRWKTRDCKNQVGTRTISSEFETSACSLATACLTCGTSTSISGQSFSTTALDSTTPSVGRLSASEPQPTVEKLGFTSNQSDLFKNGNTTSPNIAFDAPSPSRSAFGVTGTKLFGQSDTLAFDSASRMDTLSCSVSTAAFSSQSASSLPHACKSSTVSCDLSSIPVAGFEFMQQPSAGTFGSPSDHSSPFASSTAFGMTSSTSASKQQSTTTEVGLNSNQSSPLVSNAFTSHALFGAPSQYAFGTPSTSVFGQSNATVMGKAGSMPALFGSTATTMSTSTSAFGFKNSLSYLFRTSSNSFDELSNAPASTFVSGSQTITPGNQVTTPKNQTTMPGSQKTISESQATTLECQMATQGNQVTAPGNQTTAHGNQVTAPGNQTTKPECETTPECQMTTPDWQTGISDQQKSIETPYSSTQNTSGKSMFILDKSSLKDKHHEELSREDYHGVKGYDQEQVQAWGQAQSSPLGVTNIASSFDQSPKSATPKPPVVVTSEDSKGSGDTPYKATKISVWWDIENCQVPRGSDTYYIAKNISSALADAGYKGAVTISAYGDTHKIPNAVQQALSSTGIALNHVPAGVKDASDKKILVDMLFWAVDNPPPANYLLISGDRDFSNALHQLRLRRYNILLAHAPSVSQALVAAAKKVWQWSSLLSGGPPLQDLEPSARTSGANRSSFNGIKGHITKRLKWKDQNASETRKTCSVPQSEEGCDIHSEKLASFPRVSMPEANEITGLKRAPTSSLSCEIVCAKRPRDSLNSSEQMPLESMFHSGNEKNQFNGQPFKVSQLLAPSNSAPSQNTTNNNFITQPHHQHIMFGPPHLRSMHNKSTTNHHENIKLPQLCNGYQVHCSEVHRHIGHIVSALIELKANKIVPTEENISNCIRYGMGKQSIDVKMGLNYACKNNMLTRYNFENCTPIYVEKNEEFWECVNVLNINDKHSEETWNAVRYYLSSASGQLGISSTECRYHAATVLKKSCLQHLPLGDVLQLLNAVIKFRKWIIPSPSGWQPLTFTIKVLPSGNAKD